MLLLRRRRRLAPIAVGCALAGVALMPGRGIASPARGGTNAAVADTSHERFWTALSSLEVELAIRRAPDADHRAFAEAFGRMIGGRGGEAESALRQLSRSARDSVLRLAAHITLASVLEYQGKWAELYMLSQDSLQPVANLDGGRAGLSRWSAAMRGVAQSTLHFPDREVIAPLLVNPLNTPMVDIVVNGQRKRFWLDTGSSISLIASDVATEFGLTPITDDTLEIVTSVGRVAAHPTIVPRMDISGLIITNQAAAIIEKDALSLAQSEPRAGLTTVSVDGVIGTDLLRRLSVEIDYEHQRVTLRPPAKPDRRRARNLFWLGYPVVRLTSARGTVLHFGLDTGADASYATDALLAKQPRLGSYKRMRRVAGFGGDTVAAFPSIADLRVTLDGQKVQLHDLAVRETKRLIFVDLDGMFGSDLALGRVVRFDLTNGIFALER
ncbi:MAG: retroviral-like aspartic protease family protein [Gemmatimonadota bacterium]|nr:retroviral-like aspartic protease family protein [Gemmatimonadota bacterium]